MAEPPSVSVIVPCLDAEAHLAATLRSVLNQTRPPIEILVIDNGSQDGSPEIAQSFGPQVRLLRAPMRGAPLARIAGAAEARGAALMFLDADDLLDPDVIEALSDALAKAPETAAVCPWDRLNCARDAAAAQLAIGPATPWLAAPPSCAPRLAGQDDLDAWLSHWWTPPCGVLWSRAAYRRSGGWDPQVAVNQDGDLMMRAFLAGVQLTPTSKGRAFYRRRAGDAPSLSGTRKTRAGACAGLAVLARIEELLAAQGAHARRAGPLAKAYDVARGHLGDALEDLAAYCDGARRRLAQSPPGPPPTAADLPTGVDALGPPPAPRDVRLGAEAAAETPPPPAPAAIRAEPLVSVVIPTFNRPATTVRAIESALTQDWPALEVIVVDDASIDDTAARVAEVDDPRLRLIRQPQNGGVARARNCGMDAARGEIIGFIDSDDEWLPNKLALQVPALLSAPRRTAIVHGGVETVLGDGQSWLFQPPPGGRMFEALLRKNVLHAFPTVALLKREVIEAVGGFDPSFPAIEDWEFEIRAARFFDVATVASPVARYHDDLSAEVSGDRRSRRRAQNLAARRMLHQRYWREMRAAGVEIAFMKETAGRHFGPGFVGRAGAARTLLAALRRHPAAADLYVWLASCGLPGSIGGYVRRRFGGG